MTWFASARLRRMRFDYRGGTNVCGDKVLVVSDIYDTGIPSVGSGV